MTSLEHIIKKHRICTPKETNHADLQLLDNSAETGYSKIERITLLMSGEQ